jgi:hypothetical protein
MNGRPGDIIEVFVVVHDDPATGKRPALVTLESRGDADSWVAAYGDAFAGDLHVLDGVVMFDRDSKARGVGIGSTDHPPIAPTQERSEALAERRRAAMAKLDPADLEALGLGRGGAQ